MRDLREKIAEDRQAAEHRGRVLTRHELKKLPTMASVQHSLRVQYLRHVQQGMSIQELAKITGVPMGAMSVWLRAYRPINKVKQLDKLLAGLLSIEMAKEIL